MEKSKPAHQLSSAQPASSSLPHSAAQFSGPVRDLPPSRSGPSRTGLLPRADQHPRSAAARHRVSAAARTPPRSGPPDLDPTIPNRAGRVKPMGYRLAPVSFA